MKANYMNYFKDKKLYQWDKNSSVYTITDTDIEGEFCLDQQQMNLFLKFKNPEITLGATLTVKSGKTKSNIKLTKCELVLPTMEFTSEFKLSIETLKLANNFVAKNDVRPILTGVNINNSYVAATDTFTMFKRECKSECNITIASDFIKEISHAKGDINFKVNDKVVCCEVEGTTYIGRVLSGTFPPMIASLYTNDGVLIKLKKEDFDILSYSNNKADYFHIEKTKLTLSGENEIEREIELNEDIDIWFNAEKVANVIKSINSDEIEIRYIGPLKQITINDEILVLPIKRK